MNIRPAKALRGQVHIPGDKSISHRAVMFGALAKGTTRISHFLEGADCLSTISCFRKLGVKIEKEDDIYLVHGQGLRGLQAPTDNLDCGNSGTTIRLISGILSAQPFTTILTGDESIQKRPMRRIADPLQQMGAHISSLNSNGCAPLRIEGAPLHGITYQSPVASAQVKSAILLAGLYADAPTTVIEPSLSRDHTERMLTGFGAKITTNGNEITIEPTEELYAQDIFVPGDISSAAYFMAAATLVPGSEILIHNVGINPTRDGILHIMRNMGADITILNERAESSEPVADLLIKHAPLHGTTIEGTIIPTLIDEIPILAVLAAFADGTTIIRDAAELKVKESDRIHSVATNLRNMGADVIETEDGMIINGGNQLHGATIDSYLDHRIAMSFTVAALAATGDTNILGADCVNISYPNFYKALNTLQ